MRILNGIFIVLFMAMLTLPLIFVDLSPDRVSVRENRMLANRPALTDIKSQPEIFIRHFDDWFKDSTGFREQLIMFFNVISKSKWYNSIWYADGQYIYLIGEEGHHYFAGDGKIILKFQGKQFLTDAQLTGMATKLEEVKTYLDEQGIPLIVMFCTDKESIYPEFYPKSIKRGPEPIQLDVITEYLIEHTMVDVFNIKQALLAEKSNFMLYAVSSGDLAHYNEIGAFFAYRELMRHINIYFPEIISYELNDVDICYDRAGVPNASLKKEKAYKKLDKSFFNDVNISRPFTWENEAYENTYSDLPVILFLRDSYAEELYIGKYIAQHFSKAIFIHYSNMEHFDEYIDRYKPDIVVFESAERALDGFAGRVTGIPKLR
jgi:hypothetical protein